jgi:hypothetical protein
VSFAAITLYVASQRVFTVVCVHFFMDSVRKLLDTPLYINQKAKVHDRSSGVQPIFIEVTCTKFKCKKDPNGQKPEVFA